MYRRSLTRRATRTRPVVSLAFVGVPLPADPQAVQERATPLGACGSGRLPIVRRRVFVGFPPQLGLTRSPINGWHENPSSRRRVMGRASLSALALSVRVPPSPCLPRYLWLKQMWSARPFTNHKLRLSHGVGGTGILKPSFGNPSRARCIFFATVGHSRSCATPSSVQTPYGRWC